VDIRILYIINCIILLLTIIVDNILWREQKKLLAGSLEGWGKTLKILREQREKKEILENNIKDIIVKGKENKENFFITIEKIEKELLK